MVWDTLSIPVVVAAAAQERLATESSRTQPNAIQDVGMDLDIAAVLLGDIGLRLDIYSMLLLY